MPTTIKNLIYKCYKCGEKDPSNFYPSDHKKCKKCSRDYNKGYRKKNKGKIKLQRTEYQRKVRQKIINTLGGKCIKCGFSDWRALQIDHINGGGVQELRNRKSWMQYYTNVLDNPDKYQLLCANCNWIKRYEENENGLREGVGIMAKRVVLTFLKKNAKEAEVSIKDEDGESYKIPLQRNSQKGGKVQVYKDLRGNPYTLPKGGWRPTESDAVNPANTYIKAINEIGETAPKGKIVRRVLAPAVERAKGWISQKQRIEALKGPIREKFAERAKEPSQQNLGRYQRLSDLKKDLSKTADQRYKDRVAEIQANKWNSGEQKADLIADAMKTYEADLIGEKLTPEQRRDQVLAKLAGPTGKVDPAQRSQVMDRFRVEKEIEASKEAGGQGPGSGGNPCR